MLLLSGNWDTVVQSQRYPETVVRRGRRGHLPARLHSLNVTVQRLNRPQNNYLTAGLSTVWSFLQNHIEFHIKDNNNFTESSFRKVFYSKASPVTVPQCSRFRVNGQFVWTFLCESPRAGRPGPVRSATGRSGPVRAGPGELGCGERVTLI